MPRPLWPHVWVGCGAPVRAGRAMTNRAELVAQIRFALANLSARNGHHEFEALCLEVARQTVTPNILPATGPVAGRGDQGRDFETFRSRVTPRLGETGLLLGLDGQDLVAFACTLQRTGLARKIKSDIEAICSDGEPVAAVVAYCETNLAVGDRHRLQADARSQWGIPVEIVDGEGLADRLADQSLFWAATRYLSIPAALAPEQHEPSRYEDNLVRWRSRIAAPSSPGDFFALRNGLREATFAAERRPDVPFWLSRMQLLIDSGSPDIDRRARYEVVLGTLRGLGNLLGTANARLVEDLLSDAERSDDESRLADAAVILVFCVGARLAGAFDVDNASLMSWNGRLRDRVRTLLAGDLDEGRRCSLLDVLGGLCLQPDMTDVEPSGRPQPIDMDRLMALVESGGPAATGSTPILVDRDAAVAAWLDLARRLDRNWLYPVDPLASRLGIMAPFILDVDGYGELTRLVDEAVGRRSGKSAVAARCRTRAMALANAGRTRDALIEVHRARVEWLNADTLRGSLLAQTFAAHCYLTLNLPLAARYFWLATAFLASREPALADLVPPALCGASTADYHAGAWFGALELADLALGAQAMLTDDPWDPTRFEYLSGTLFDLTIIDACARRLGAPYLLAASRVIDRFGMRAFLDEAVPPNPWWEGLSTEDLGAYVARELGQPGFSDAGPIRTIAWRALGIDWRLTVANEHPSVVAAERLAAILQVAAAELSRDELLIAPTEVRMTVSIRGRQEPRTRPEFRPSNNGREWAVSLLAPDDAGTGEDAFSDAIIVLFDVLGDTSLLNPDELDRLVQTALHEGLIERFAPMLLYDRIVPISRSRFEESNRGAAAPMPLHEASPREHPDLQWPRSAGPGYTPAEGADRVRSRYERFRELMPYSIPWLMRDVRVQGVCDELRGEGWKDWHLLQAITSITMSFRISRLGFRDMETAEIEGRRISQNPESPRDPTPPRDEITVPAMKTALRVSMLVTLRGWGLSLRQATPDFPAIERLLGQRYGFWDDDVTHDRWWEPSST
jgi:hypothetical protein